MKRIYILCGHIRNTSVIYGYYATLDGAKKALIRQEMCFGNVGLNPKHAAPLSDEEQARVIYERNGDYYGRLFIQSNILND